MNRSLLIAATALFLAACAPAAPRWHWTHPRLGEEERAAALAECRRLTRAEAPSPFVAYPSGAEFYQEREGLFNRCMEERGWTAEEP